MKRRETLKIILSFRKSYIEVNKRFSTIKIFRIFNNRSLVDRNSFILEFFPVSIIKNPSKKFNDNSSCNQFLIITRNRYRKRDSCLQFEHRYFIAFYVQHLENRKSFRKILFRQPFNDWSKKNNTGGREPPPLDIPHIVWLVPDRLHSGLKEWTMDMV